MYIATEDKKEEWKWYDYELDNLTQMNKVILYLTTFSINFSIHVLKTMEGRYKGHIVCEIKLNEQEIFNWYNEIEGGE